VRLKAEAEEIVQSIDRDREVVSKLAETRAALETELAAMREERDTTQARRDALREQSAPLQQRLDAATPQEPSEATPAGTPGASADREPPSGKRRDPVVVAAALRDAPGLPPADSTDTARLRQALVEGKCATDLLEEIFGTINRQTLLSLVRSLGPC
jgi:hypothetical protein